MSRLFLFGGLVCSCPSAALLGSRLRRMFVKQFAGAWRRGESFTSPNWYAYPAGAYFCSYKSRQNTLGALPQDPCRWLCWIRIDFRWESKINPYCAQNRSQSSLRQHLPFPPTPFPDGGKGARMG